MTSPNCLPNSQGIASPVALTFTISSRHPIRSDKKVVNRLLRETSSGSFAVNETLMQTVNLDLPGRGHSVHVHMVFS